MFYSAQTKGFYITNIHGLRTILIDDPAWVRPLIDVTLQPGESIIVDGVATTNDTEEPMTVSDVPDMAAVPSQIEVDNPDCLLPDDAVEITSAVHAQLLADQSSGATIQADINGYPVAVFPPAPTKEQIEAAIIAELTAAVQLHLDNTAKQRNYDNILSLCTYATSTNPTFAAEGQAGVNWRDACWTKCYEVMAAVKAGTRAIPTAEELVAELPLIVWPS